MLKLAFITWAAITFTVICWFFYIAIMGLKERRAQLHPIARAVAYYGLALALALDVALNLTASLVLLDLPRELMFTGKLKRLKRGGGWRARLASWICERMLDQFDPDGKHC